MKILVVDDECLILETFRDLAECLEWNVVCVSSGQEAISRCKQKQFNIAIIDLTLQPLNGIEIANQLSIPCLLITATVTNVNLRLLRESGYPYLFKPFHINDLIEMVKCYAIK